MGRARRNQRDAIRKQRAKRRKKGQDSDDDDSDGEDFDYRQLQSRRSSQKNKRGLLNNNTTRATTEPVTADSGEDGTKKQNDQGSACRAEKSTKTSGESNSSSPIKAGAAGTTVKAPMDRIERMRLKKQQQKAARKQKKADKLKLMQS